MRKRGRDLDTSVTHVFWNRERKKEREREERAKDERERERIEARRASRVSGRAEVTVRCENSFESSPRLIVEEGRSSTGLLCRSCSPLFPPCSCYPNRKVGIAITIVRSFQPEIRASIYRYLSIFINHSIFFFLTSSMIDSWLKFLSVIFWTRFKRYVHRINFSVGKNDGNRWKKRVAWKFYTKTPGNLPFTYLSCLSVT